MRIIVIKEAADLQTLSSTLFNIDSSATGNAVAHKATLERIKSLNPQVDFQSMAAGTVLLLPDAPELKDSESQSIAGDAFADFTNHLTEGFKTVVKRVRSGAKVLAADREAVTAVLTTEAVKNLIKSDSLLEKQLDGASKEFSIEQEKALEAAKQVDLMQEAVALELTALAGLLR